MLIRTITAAAAAATLLAGCGTDAPATPTAPAPTATAPTTSQAAPVVISGALTVPGAWIESEPITGNLCIPDDGYRDVTGAQVVLADDDGNTLVVAPLQSGRIPALSDADIDRAVTTREIDCVHEFTLAPPPGTEFGPGYYSIGIGRRGKLRYTREQLLAGHLNFTLGE